MRAPRGCQSITTLAPPCLALLLAAVLVPPGECDARTSGLSGQRGEEGLAGGLGQGGTLQGPGTALGPEAMDWQLPQHQGMGEGDGGQQAGSPGDACVSRVGRQGGSIQGMASGLQPPLQPPPPHQDRGSVQGMGRGGWATAENGVVGERLMGRGADTGEQGAGWEGQGVQGVQTLQDLKAGALAGEQGAQVEVEAAGLAGGEDVVMLEGSSGAREPGLEPGSSLGGGSTGSGVSGDGCLGASEGAAVEAAREWSIKHVSWCS